MSLESDFKGLMVWCPQLISILSVHWKDTSLSCTISSLTSVDIDNEGIPYLGFSIKLGSRLDSILDSSKIMYISILGSGQAHIAEYFAVNRGEGSDNQYFHHSEDLIVAGSPAGLKCQFDRQVVVKNSRFVVCKVKELFFLNPTAIPLTYQNRRFK